MYRENPLKARLKAGRKSLGLWLGLGSASVAEIVAQCGYDFVIMDHEHSPATLRDAVAQMQAISATPTTSVMRVPWNDAVYLKQAIDTGVEGVMVPMIETAEDARRAVAACRYPPRGFRGSAFPAVRASDYGLRGMDYVRTAHERLLIIGQIESLKAVKNIGEIVAVDGIDVFFLGPYDLSGTVGHFGELEHPAVTGPIAEAESVIKQHGKWMGTVPHRGLDAQGLFARGYDIVAASTDATLLREAALAELRAHRGNNP
jgi:2-keto-3-deoxy-L-rhamnonate aldolase RhmA